MCGQWALCEPLPLCSSSHPLGQTLEAPWPREAVAFSLLSTWIVLLSSSWVLKLRHGPSLSLLCLAEKGELSLVLFISSVLQGLIWDLEAQ